ncbi:MAG: hypothetical protein ACLGHY_14380, partial [Gammaproteobacteria bacterium]
MKTPSHLLHPTRRPEPGPARSPGGPGARTPHAALVAAVGRGLLIFAITFVACVIARLVSPPSPGVLLIWPGAGVALAFAWRRGAGWTLPAAFGAAAWAWFDTGDPVFATVALLASAAGPAAATRLMQWLGDWKPADYRLDASMRFALAAVLLAAPVDALIAAAGLPLTVAGDNANGIQRFLVWWLVDALGMLLIAPALMVWL